MVMKLLLSQQINHHTLEATEIGAQTTELELNLLVIGDTQDILRENLRVLQEESIHTAIRGTDTMEMTSRN